MLMLVYILQIGMLVQICWSPTVICHLSVYFSRLHVVYMETPFYPCCFITLYLIRFPDQHMEKQLRADSDNETDFYALLLMQVRSIMKEKPTHIIFLSPNISCSSFRKKLILITFLSSQN